MPNDNIMSLEEANRYLANPDPNRMSLTEAQRVSIKDEPSVFNDLEQPEAIDYFRRYIGRFIPGLIPLATYTAMPGGPVVKGVAAAEGSLVGSELQNQFPRIFGTVPSPTARLGEAAMSGAAFPIIDKIYGGLSRAALDPKLPILAFINKHFKNIRPIEDRAAILEHPDISLTAPQISGNRSSIYSRLIDPTKEEQIAVQQGLENRTLAERLSTGRSGEDIIKDMQSGIIPTGRHLPNVTQRTMLAGVNPNITFQQVRREILSDPLKARNVVAEVGPERVRELYFNKLVEDSMVKDGFNAGKALNDLLTDSPILKEFTNSAQRQNAERLLRVLAIRGVGGKSSLQSAIQLAEGRYGLQIGSGAIEGLTGGNVPTSAKTGVLFYLLRIPSQNFLSRVLLNPTYARMTVTGLTGPSGPARLASAGLVKVMQGLAGLDIQTPDGKTYPATVGKDGKVRIVRNFQ